ncbi:hypothetical protein ISN45_Aa04g009630 [Arabidopsis thaliana x Arabidopsis arenosa]|uniref:Uncharacterized protein n=1 Tax=Arabidopsis thaliana x Arabidopsis arenosa TaxID=1240361 RepID=A0A8T2A5B9_9BRAS|nr:hypothetical protein ISN45_Aa04g009630 [Arabidopsis thaliana x Arabidopsis arenosa]
MQTKRKENSDLLNPANPELASYERDGNKSRRSRKKRKTTRWLTFNELLLQTEKTWINHLPIGAPPSAIGAPPAAIGAQLPIPPIGQNQPPIGRMEKKTEEEEAWNEEQGKMYQGRRNFQPRPQFNNQQAAYQPPPVQPPPNENKLEVIMKQLMDSQRTSFEAINNKVYGIYSHLNGRVDTLSTHMMVLENIVQVASWTRAPPGTLPGNSNRPEHNISVVESDFPPKRVSGPSNDRSRHATDPNEPYLITNRYKPMTDQFDKFVRQKIAESTDLISKEDKETLL